MKDKQSFVPTPEQCLALLNKYNTPKNVIEHCILVRRIAEEFCDKIPDLNRNLVVAGALLHDIGRSITHSIRHAVEGAKLLEKENVDQRVINIVKKHIGTGISLEESKKLGLPPDDYIPHTPEEIVVSYADNLACGSEKCTFEVTLRHFIKKFGESSTVVSGFIKQRDFIEKLIKEAEKKKRAK